MSATAPALSFLDLGSPATVASRARWVEGLGFRRAWYSEHYAARQNPDPFTGVAIAAQATEALRVGTGAVLLRTTTALRAAFSFAALLEAFGDRVDIGLSMGVPGDDAFIESLSGRRPLSTSELEDRLASAVAILGGRTAMPALAPDVFGAAPIWLCGSSMKAALLAAALGVNFSFHVDWHTARGLPYLPGEIVSAYRDAYGGDDQPRANVCVFAYCAESDFGAAEGWFARFGARSGVHSIGVLGGPETARQQLADIAGECVIDEVVVAAVGPDEPRILRSLELCAMAAR